MDDFLSEIIPVILSLGVYVLLGLIPANIAKKKGRSFFGWWVYGTILFVVALIHAALISPKAYTPSQSVAPYSRKQYVKTALLFILSAVLFDIFEPMYFSENTFLTIVNLVFAIFLLVNRNKGTNIVLMFSFSPLLISAVIDVFKHGTSYGGIYTFRALMMLAGTLYLFLVMFFGAMPTRRDTALSALKARALGGVFMVIWWILGFVIFIAEGYMDADTLYGAVIGGFLRVMAYFSLGKSLLRVYGIDHPYARAAAYAARYASSSSTTRTTPAYTTSATAANTTTQSKPATTYSPASSSSISTTYAQPKPGTTATYTRTATPTSAETPTPTPAPTPTPVEEKPVETVKEPAETVSAPAPTPAPKEEPKKEQKKAAKKEQKKEEKKPVKEEPKVVPVAAVPAQKFPIVLEGAKERVLTVLEDRVVLHGETVNPDNDLTMKYDSTFMYAEIEDVKFRKGGVGLGSLTFKLIGATSESEDEIFGAQSFPYNATALPNAQVEEAYRIIKKQIRAAKR